MKKKVMLVLMALLFVCPLIIRHSLTSTLAVSPEISSVSISNILEVTANITYEEAGNITEIVEFVSLTFQIDGYWYMQNMTYNSSTSLYHFLIPAYNQLGDKTIHYYVEVKTIDNQTITSDVFMHYVPDWVRTDLNRDGRVDMRDIGFAARNFGLPIGEDVGFEDDFESYAIGTFPDTWDLVFNGAGNAYQIVVNNVSVSPNQSLQLKGTNSWNSVAARYIYTTAPTLSFEVYVMIEEVLGTTAHSSRVGFWSLKPNGWGRWYCQVVFLNNGSLMCGGQLLQSYEAGTWYKVNQTFDRSANTVSVWINDVQVGIDIPGLPTVSPYDVQAFALSGQGSGVTTYYDNVKFTAEP
ncbi:MAG: hypothetical protein PVH12_08390 [Candidatus Bathyarchaeota archaeon]